MNVSIDYRGADPLGKFLQYVLRAAVNNGMNRIEPQAVYPKLLDPVQCILNHEFANGPTLRTIEIDCRAPRRLVPLREKLRRIQGEVIAVGTEGVVYDIQHDHEPALVRGLDERF